MSPVSRGKNTKEEVHYEDIAHNPNEKCAGCKHFRPYPGRRDRNGCAKVMGDINEKGWCQLFAPAAGGPKRPPREEPKSDAETGE